LGSNWLSRVKQRLAPFAENVAEASAACLVTMVQGNLMALSLSHWLIASETGLIAGVLASVAILVARTRRRWVIAIVLGVLTGVVDFFVHPGMFGPVALEAFVTGLGAAVLSLAVGALFEYVSRMRQRIRPVSP
jgi:hypothetical protein